MINFKMKAQMSDLNKIVVFRGCFLGYGKFADACNLGMMNAVLDI
tara:strand:+ start:91 stop:225 length:135 start_codon:yes stop_codon:yes gene_type:complete